MSPIDQAAVGNLELLMLNRLVLKELQRRNVVRSNNLVGDFGEYLAAPGWSPQTGILMDGEFEARKKQILLS